MQPLLLDLVDRGVIRILDIAFLAKDRDGSLSGMEVGGGLNKLAATFAEFERASSGLLGEDDLREAATAVSNRVSRRQAERWQQQGSYPYGQPEPAYAEQQPAYEAAVQPPPPQLPRPTRSSCSRPLPPCATRAFSPTRSSRHRS